MPVTKSIGDGGSWRGIDDRRAWRRSCHGLQDCKMKSPHAAVLGPHAGQVERYRATAPCRRSDATTGNLARPRNIDRRQLSAAYPQSRKREIWPSQQRLAAHEFTGVNL